MTFQTKFDVLLARELDRLSRRRPPRRRVLHRRLYSIKRTIIAKKTTLTNMPKQRGER